MWGNDTLLKGLVLHNLFVYTKEVLLPSGIQRLLLHFFLQKVSLQAISLRLFIARVKVIYPAASAISNNGSGVRQISGSKRPSYWGYNTVCSPRPGSQASTHLGDLTLRCQRVTVEPRKRVTGEPRQRVTA